MDYLSKKKILPRWDSSRGHWVVHPQEVMVRPQHVDPVHQEEADEVRIDPTDDAAVDLMVVGEPFLMGGEFGEEDERLISCLENSAEPRPLPVNPPTMADPQAIIEARPIPPSRARPLIVDPLVNMEIAVVRPPPVSPHADVVVRPPPANPPPTLARPPPVNPAAGIVGPRPVDSPDSPDPNGHVESTVASSQPVNPELIPLSPSGFSESEDKKPNVPPILPPEGSTTNPIKREIKIKKIVGSNQRIDIQKRVKKNKEYYHSKYSKKSTSNITETFRLSDHGENLCGRGTISCPLCAKTFSLWSHYDAHIKCHQKLKQQQYPCQTCGKIFPSAGNRNLHQRIHKGVRPFQCTPCGVFFRQKAHLQMHIKSQGHIKATKIYEKKKCDGLLTNEDTTLSSGGSSVGTRPVDLPATMAKPPIVPLPFDSNGHVVATMASSQPVDHVLIPLSLPGFSESEDKKPNVPPILPPEDSTTEQRKFIERSPPPLQQIMHSEIKIEEGQPPGPAPSPHISQQPGPIVTSSSSFDLRMAAAAGGYGLSHSGVHQLTHAGVYARHPNPRDPAPPTAVVSTPGAPPTGYCENHNASSNYPPPPLAHNWSQLWHSSTPNDTMSMDSEASVSPPHYSNTPNNRPPWKTGSTDSAFMSTITEPFNKAKLEVQAGLSASRKPRASGGATKACKCNKGGSTPSMVGKGQISDGTDQGGNKRVYSSPHCQRSYRCPQCQRSYNLKSNLKRHLRFECGKEKAFQCAKCGQKFSHKQNCVSHLKRKHKIVCETIDQYMANGLVIYRGSANSAGQLIANPQ